jgi:hypothetical protein
MIIPTSSGGLIILPDNNGPIGPWTNGDTKIVITILILSLIMLMISVIVEKLRGFTLQEIFTLSEDGWTKLLSAYTIFSVILFYIAWVGGILYGIGYLIYGML